MTNQGPGRSSSRRTRLAATAVVVMVAALLAPLTAGQAAAEGKDVVGGKAIYSDGSPAAGVKTNLYAAETPQRRGGFLGKAFSNGAGEYRYDGLDAGCYIVVGIAPLGAEFGAPGSGRVYDQQYVCTPSPDALSADLVLYREDTKPPTTTTTVAPTTSTTAAPTTTTTVAPTTTTTEPRPPTEPPTYCGYNPRAGALAIYGSGADSFLLYNSHDDVTPFAVVRTADSTQSGGPPGNRPELGDYVYWGGLPGFSTFTLHVEAKDDDSKKPSKRIPCTAGSSPIALDIDGSGLVERVSADVAFDFAGDGEMVTAGEWFAPTEGILFDTRIDGPISGAHLFGDQAGTYADGFEKLALRDVDGDGRVAGAELDGLAIWTDVNTNGILDQGERSSLADHGVVSLSTSHRNMVSTAGLVDGSVMVTEDLWFPVADGVPAGRSLQSIVLLALGGVGLVGYAVVAQRRRRVGLDAELAELLGGAEVG